MRISSGDKEFKKYWLLLTDKQKESLLNLIKSFAEQDEEINIEKYNLELHEARAEYKSGRSISHQTLLKQLKEWQKKAIVLFIKTFLKKDNVSTSASIRQYNKEIDEAMKRMDSGEFISHEDVEKESRQW